ncbi:LuxR C-terminal-related transcriptional regulator [Nonomuraea sp. B12E4]|uniref:LuxR C-terminal-related transcriptional regulator n=1 Tax=Nonomuraea sp. B12E4 TaxID=3153564 RepID=UPI00325E6B33
MERSGKSSPEIGAELFISVGTAEIHVANVQRKLGVRATAWASPPGVAAAAPIAQRNTSSQDETGFRAGQVVLVHTAR